MESEVGGGIGMGNTCKPMAVSFQCMTKSTTNKKKKESACNAEDLGSVPGLGRSLGEGNGNPLQCSGLENPMDGVVHGVAESDMTEGLALSRPSCWEGSDRPGDSAMETTTTDRSTLQTLFFLVPPNSLAH